MFKFRLKIMLAAAILLMWGCRLEEPVQEPVRPVMVMTVAESGSTITRIFPGRMSPAQEVDLSFRVSSRIEHFPVKKGQYLKAGDIVASLDPRDFEIQVRSTRGSIEEAEASLRAMQTGARVEDIQSLEAKLAAARTLRQEAELQYVRYSDLHETGAVATAVLDRALSEKQEAASHVSSLEMELKKARTGSREEDIEALRARIRSLEAGLDQARSALEDSVLPAPFDGYVAEKYVDTYQNVSAGQPVARLQDMSRLEITIGLPEQLMVLKDAIKSIHVRLETYPEHFFPARIKEVSLDAAAPTLTYQLTAIMDRPLDIPVFPSMAADVYIAFGSPSGTGHIEVPETALVSGDDGQSLLWMFDPDTGTVAPRKVTPGRITGKGVHIAHGLMPGETIVVAGAEFLRQGQKVRVVGDD